MRLWAEERRLGTIEMLLTLPITQWQAVLGKFLAAWAFCAIALVLTFPFCDHRQRARAARQRRDRCRAISARCWWPGRSWRWARRCRRLTKNQVIAFVLSVAVCFLFAVASYPLVTDFLSARACRNWPRSRAASASLDRFQDFTRGVVSLRDLMLLRDLHPVLAVPEHGDRRTAQGGLSDGRSDHAAVRGAASGPPLVGVLAVLAIVIGINMLADARLSRAQADLTQQRHLFAVRWHQDDPAPI